MKSLKVATISGIPVLIHPTFIIFFLILFIVMTIKSGITESLPFIAQVSTVFLIVCLHEFAHILTGLRYGVKTDNITLLPIGGAASITNLPTNPWHEFLMAVAGPLSNVCLALIGNVVKLLVNTDILWVSKSLDFFVTVNIVLPVFNLLPIFPMDGGRILRSMLQVITRIKRHTATNIAYYAGIVVVSFAISFGISVGNYMVIVVLGFITFMGFIEMTEERRLYNVKKWEPILNDYMDEFYKHITKTCHMVEFLKKIEKDKRIEDHYKCCLLYNLIYNKEDVPCVEYDLDSKCPCNSSYKRDMSYAISYYEKAGCIGQIDSDMEDVFIREKIKSGII